MSKINKTNYSRAWYQANKEKVIARTRKYYFVNKVKIAAYNREYRSVNKIRIAANKRKYSITNRNKIAARTRAWNIKNKIRIVAHGYKYRRVNKNKKAIYDYAYRRANKDKKAAYNRSWRFINPDKIAVRRRTRRARKVGAKGSHTRHDIDRLYFKQRGRCASLHCRIYLASGYHIDHKIPLSRGGSDYPRNLQLMCQPCNDSKGTRTMKEWLKRLKVLDDHPGDVF